ncbi:TetR/AcrR family transcriptional regulator [Amycolatopsis saalfeldensis]|uniref:DNA-binding transcriptional regulator YbjK n=1 Tax=Amycolatopsis saalfeldensis TaxID=394193 RepID=A0A1H8X2W7_9PSEU|nr:TetR/AcrR family transcriptional regulator [Amycolatopsis saalfeldensis]SEP34073.1 DNA-binding transcriptional regulator YbjK [Amycolatopsis saalfeldensis]
MAPRRAQAGERVDRKRRDLVVAAYETIVRTGLANLRTREVAAAAGITVATLHYYFPAKDDLVRAVLEYAIRERIVAALAVEDVPGGLRRIRAMVGALRARAAAQPGMFRLLHEMIWLSHDDPALATLLAGWHGEWHEAIRGWLADARAAGEVRPDLDLAETATALMYLVFGLVLRPPLPGGVPDDVTAAVELVLSRRES